MAVYTEVSYDELDDFIAGYDIGVVTACKGIAEGIENSNYLLRTETGTFILTLYEKRVKPENLPFFLGLMDHLAAKGIRAPVPVKGRDGEALRELCGRPAAIVTFLDGRWRRRISPQNCSALGEALARMHVAGGDFTMSRDNDFSLSAWRHLFEETKGRADEVKPGLAAVLEDEIGLLSTEWPSGLPAGIIHADLFPDNVFFQGEELSGIIDFYFACRDFFAYELAICLNAWCFEVDGDFNITKARRFLNAYREVRDFSPEELEYLPLMCRGASMRFLLTRLYDWLNPSEDALVTPKNPLEYLEKLRFHQQVKGPGDYGLPRGG